MNQSLQTKTRSTVPNYLTTDMQRAFFAYCSERGQAIGWLENMLLPAGLERVDGLLHLAVGDE